MLNPQSLNNYAESLSRHAPVASSLHVPLVRALASPPQPVPKVASALTPVTPVPVELTQPIQPSLSPDTPATASTSDSLAPPQLIPAVHTSAIGFAPQPSSPTPVPAPEAVTLPVPTPPPAVQIPLSNTAAPELRGWNWGAFSLGWIWGLAHNYPLSLLIIPASAIPFLGLAGHVYLGLNGNQLAWKNRVFVNAQQFTDVQKIWSAWGIGLFCLWILIIPVTITTLVIAQLGTAGHKQHDAVRKNDITQLGRAVEMYKSDTTNSVIPTSLATIEAATHRSDSLIDPYTKRPYEFSTDGTLYTVTANLELNDTCPTKTYQVADGVSGCGFGK